MLTAPGVQASAAGDTLQMLLYDVCLHSCYISLLNDTPDSYGFSLSTHSTSLFFTESVFWLQHITLACRMLKDASDYNMNTYALLRLCLGGNCSRQLSFMPLWNLIRGAHSPFPCGYLPFKYFHQTTKVHSFSVICQLTMNQSSQTWGNLFKSTDISKFPFASASTSRDFKSLTCVSTTSYT